MNRALGAACRAFFQARQARLVGIADGVHVEEKRQFQFAHGGEELQVLGIVDGNAALVFANADGSGVDVTLQHVECTLATLQIGQLTRVDIDEGEQPVAVPAWSVRGPSST